MNRLDYFGDGTETQHRPWLQPHTQGIDAGGSWAIPATSALRRDVDREKGDLMNQDPQPQEIVVRDIRMRFGSMVIFMVKWAFAAIPALLIIVFLTVAATLFASGMMTSLMGALSHKATSETTTGSPSPNDKPDDEGATAYLDKVLVRNLHVGETVLGETGVWGEVKNTGDRTLKSVEIVIYCLGPGGKPVFEKTYSPVLVTDTPLFGQDNQPLRPGYSQKFGVKLDDAPSDWTKKVEVKVTNIAFQ